MYLNSVSARGKQMVKKASILIIAILCMASLYAATTSHRFSIVWNKTIEATTTMSILEYPASSTAALENNIKALEINSDKQGVAKIKYVSNEGGTHTLSFKATPLMNTTDPNGYAFNLFFNYTDPETGVAAQEVHIEVGTNKSLTYPNGQQIEASMSLNLGTGGSLTPRYVFIQAQLLDQSIDAMPTEVTYSSTITIERTSL